MQAIGLLELTWTSERSNVAITAEAFSLLSTVDKRLTVQARSAWRWRILLLRAEVDAILAANGNQMVNPFTAILAFRAACTRCLRLAVMFHVAKLQALVYSLALFAVGAATMQGYG